MPHLEITVQHEEGLHLRPARLFVRTATKFPCDITVRNASKDSQSVDAKSGVGLLLIGVKQGDEVFIEASGEQAEEAIEALRELIESNFGE